MRSSPIPCTRPHRFILSTLVLALALALPAIASATPLSDAPGPFVWRGDDGSIEFLAPSINGNLRGSVRGIETDVLRTEMWLEHAPADAAEVTILTGDPFAVGVEIAFHDAGGPLGELWFRFDSDGGAGGEGSWVLLRQSLSDCRAVRFSPIYGAVLSVARDLGAWVERLESRASEPGDEAFASLPVLLAAQLPTAVEACPSLHRGSGECGAADDFRGCEKCCAELGNELGSACRLVMGLCAIRYSPCAGLSGACEGVKQFSASSCVDGNCIGLPGDPSCDEEEQEPCEQAGGTCQFTCLITKKGICGECPKEGQRCCR